jgi:hypothetical protein
MCDPAVVCAWCKAMLSSGTEPASHGVCPRCLQQHLGLEEEMVKAAEGTRMHPVANVSQPADPTKHPS